MKTNEVLIVAVVEGTDLADGLSAHLKQLKLSGSQSFKLHSTFLRVEILDESDSPLQSFTTCSQPYEGKGEINFYNEEFFFEQALPTYSVRVSTCFCQHVSPGVSTDQCAGMMILPLNRLEENIPVGTQCFPFPVPQHSACLIPMVHDVY